MTTRQRALISAVLVSVVALDACSDSRETRTRTASAPPVASLPEAADSVAPEEFGDSTTFDPDGYYIPRTEGDGILGRLQHVHLNSIEYYYGGELHYERPRILPPSAELAISDADSTVSSRCERVEISRDSLAFQCSDTPLGRVDIRMRLLDRRGQYWNLPDSDSGNNRIGEGEVVVTPVGGRPTRQRVAFFFYTGH